jgi:hypothetical protein
MDFRISGLYTKNIQWQALFPMVLDNLADQLVTVKVKKARKSSGSASAD